MAGSCSALSHYLQPHKQEAGLMFNLARRPRLHERAVPKRNFDVEQTLLASL